MCKLNNKLYLFDYMVGKFVGWEKKIKLELNDKSEDEILKNFGFTRLMKLLYFVCLQSVNNDTDKGPFGTFDGSLFKVFDNFWAFERGPVEKDIYMNRSLLIHYDFDGDFLCRNNRVKSDDNMLENERRLIDKVVFELQKESGFPFDNTYKLIDLSHSLELWQEARFYTPSTMNVFNDLLLKNEKIVFLKKIRNPI